MCRKLGSPVSRSTPELRKEGGGHDKPNDALAEDSLLNVYIEISAGFCSPATAMPQDSFLATGEVLWECDGSVDCELECERRR